MCAVDKVVSEQYPEDIGLNLLVFGKHLLGRTDKAPREVLDYAEERGYTLHLVKQGYAKCSTCVVSDRAIITADPSIADAAESIGADVLLVSSQGVRLDGYGCGFIGGASGNDREKVYFCGNVELHPDGAAITEFCRKHGREAVSLSEMPLYDYGTLLFI